MNGLILSVMIAKRDNGNTTCHYPNVNYSIANVQIVWVRTNPAGCLVITYVEVLICYTELHRGKNGFRGGVLRGSLVLTPLFLCVSIGISEN